MENNEIYIDGVNVAGCEYILNNKIKGKQHCPAKAMPYAKETSCICRKSIDIPYNFCKHNPNCHYKQLKRLEQENKDLKKQIESDKGLITVGGKQQYEYLQRINELEQENRWQRDEEKYLKECCIKAGKELEKHSFKWDGKEKNLVVQALQLNQLYEKLEQENKELKKVKEQLKKWNDENLKRQDDMQKWIDLAEEQRKNYRSALEEIREIVTNAFAKQRPYKEDFTEIETIINKVLNS